MEASAANARARSGTIPEAQTPPTAPSRKSHSLAIAALLPLCVAFAIQYVFWSTIRPFAWFLFYPALFFSSWIGGARAGIVSTAISTVVVWWFFIPPQHTFAKDEPRFLFPAAVFVAMGILFSLFHEHLRTTAQQLREALAEARSARWNLQRVNDHVIALIEQASDGVFVADDKGRFTEVNSAGCAMLGYCRRDIVGKLISDFVPEGDVAKLRQSRKELRTESEVAEWELRRKDGSYVPVEVSAKMLPDGRWQAFVRDITQRKHAEAEIRMLADLQSAAADLGLRVLRAASPQQMMDQAVESIASTLAVEYCNVLELQPDRKELLLRSGIGWKEGLLGHALGDGVDFQAGYTMAFEQPVVAEDVQTETRFAPPAYLQEHRIVSSMTVIVPTSTAIYGVLGVHTTRKRTFTKDEVHYLQTAANVLGPMVERYRTEQALRVSEANLNRAQEIAHIGSWYLDIAKSRIAWSDEVFRIYGIPKGTLVTYEQAFSSTHPADREKVRNAWAKALQRAPYDVEHRILVNGDIRWVRERAVVEFEGGSPVRGIGTIQDITARKLSEAHLLRISRANRALSKCNETLIRAEHEEKLLQQICDIVVREAGYRFCWVGRAEHDAGKSVRVVAQAGDGADYLASLHITWADAEQGRGPTGTCIRTRQTLIARDIATDPRMAPWRVEALKHGYASSIAIPLSVESETFGALTIYASETDAFDAEEVELLSELASDLAFGIRTLRMRAERKRAIEELRLLNAELEQRVAERTTELRHAHEREFEIGCRIQQTMLLDEPPTDIAGIGIAAMSIPTERIDGDFYAFIRHGEEYLDVIVGDVMGKGTPAALLGAATKSTILKALSHLVTVSTAKTGRLPQPKDIVSMTQAEIVHHLIELESFVTLCYARLDVKQHRLDFVDCGHTGIIHLDNKTGTAEILHGNNLPLGITEGESYEEVSVRCATGDLLLFFSDGITEARNPAGDLFGIEALRDFVCNNRDLGPAGVIEAIHKCVSDFSASERLSDDLTSVAIRFENAVVPLARAGLKIQSDLKELRAARDFVRSFCQGVPAVPLHEEDVAELELAVDEAVSNIMRHAYHGRNGELIGVDAEAFSDRIVIRLVHEGDPFDAKNAPPTILDLSRDSGLGRYILSRTVDEIAYRTDSSGRHHVVLLKLCKSTEKKSEVLDANIRRES